MKTFNYEQLKRFHGDRPGSKIYVSIRGEVFDVSTSYYLYGPGGPYHVFAGQEIARSLALFSLEEAEIGLAEIDDLDEEGHRNLKEWTAKFHKRYSKLKESRPGWTRFLPMASMAVSAFAIALLVIRSKLN